MCVCIIDRWRPPESRRLTVIWHSRAAYAAMWDVLGWHQCKSKKEETLADLWCCSSRRHRIRFTELCQIHRLAPNQFKLGPPSCYIFWGLPSNFHGNPRKVIWKLHFLPISVKWRWEWGIYMSHFRAIPATSNLFCLPRSGVNAATATAGDAQLGRLAKQLAQASLFCLSLVMWNTQAATLHYIYRILAVN